MAIDSQDPLAAARVLGLCRTAVKNATGKAKTWGVISARYVTPDGAPLTGNAESYGLLTSFGGNKPRDGGFMLALSSGCARAPNQPGACADSPDGHDKRYTTGTPKGYPKESKACLLAFSGEAHDGVGLELVLRVPTNARSFTVQENFFTFEFPTFICTEFNDFFVAMMSPKVAGLPDGNIAFDQDNNPISVNNSLLQVCTPQVAGGKNFKCPLGPTSLTGTGFDGHAATGWLQTQAPVKPGDEITLVFTIWDSGDGVLDSTVLLDRFAWSAEAASGATTAPAPTK
jgi:hypothetical protein